jgi:hypothetical protein
MRQRAALQPKWDCRLPRVGDTLSIVGSSAELLQLPTLALFQVTMASHNSLSDSGVTIPSDSENYAPETDDLSATSTEDSPQYPPSSQSSPGSPVILYTPPTLWSLLRGAGINLLLPFINGLMLGFGELFAHEAAFRLGWSGTKVCSLTITSRKFIAMARGMSVVARSNELVGVSS